MHLAITYQTCTIPDGWELLPIHYITYSSPAGRTFFENRKKDNDPLKSENDHDPLKREKDAVQISLNQLDKNNPLLSAKNDAEHFINKNKKFVSTSEVNMGVDEDLDLSLEKQMRDMEQSMQSLATWCRCDVSVGVGNKYMFITYSESCDR